MGPGILVKATLQGGFSLMVFGWAQIVMDVQPLFVLITGEGHLHGFSHSFVGAGLLGAFSALSGKYLSELGLRVLGISKQQRPIIISWWVATVSAYIGTLSHVLLDAFMHGDLHPWYPFSPENPFLGILSISELHQLCLYSGVAGGLLFFTVLWASKKSQRH